MKKIISFNRKARYNYDILKKYDAGIILLGTEVKSIKNQGCDLSASYVTVDKDRVMINNFNIPRYKLSESIDYKPKRTRELLLHKDETSKIKNFLSQKSYSVIPIEVYLKNNLVKIQIAICKGRKKYDKKEYIKNKDIQKDVKVQMKNIQKI